jgi:G3E family GTPase
MLNAPDVFRIKAILAVAGEPQRQIVHGVQTYVESGAGRDWEQGEQRTSRIVVIGRNLETDRWRDELERCVVSGG